VGRSRRREALGVEVEVPCESDKTGCYVLLLFIYLGNPKSIRRDQGWTVGRAIGTFYFNWFVVLHIILLNFIVSRTLQSIQYEQVHK